MYDCPECKNELSEAYKIVDLAQHIVRTWCPSCKVWWSVKYKTQIYSSFGDPGKMPSLSRDILDYGQKGHKIYL